MYIPEKRSTVVPKTASVQQTEPPKEEKKESPKQFISTPLSMSFSFQPTQKQGGNPTGNVSGSAPGKTAEKSKAGSLSLFFS